MIEHEAGAVCFKCQPDAGASIVLRNEHREKEQRRRIEEQQSKLERLKLEFGNLAPELVPLKKELNQLRQQFQAARDEWNTQIDRWYETSDSIRMNCAIGAAPGAIRGTDRCKRLLADLEKIKRTGLVARERQDYLSAEVERIENAIQSENPDCVRLMNEIEEVEDTLRRMGAHQDLEIS